MALWRGILPRSALIAAYLNAKFYECNSVNYKAAKTRSNLSWLRLDLVSQARDVFYDFAPHFIADTLDEGAKRRITHGSFSPNITLDLS